MPQVLIIDDDRAFCTLIRNYLGRFGYEVTARTREAAAPVSALSL